MSSDSALKINCNSSINQSISTVSHTSTEASISIATLSNIHGSPNNVDLVTELIGHDLSYVDFVHCFYSSLGGDFVINQADKSFKPLSLLAQSYKTTDNLVFKWNLYNQCLKAYSNKYNISENTISAQKKIQLTKELYSNPSLASSCGTQQSLSWDQVLLGLETTGQIIHTGDPDHNANVKFVIDYVYYSPTLEITISAVFHYHTNIPSYRNAYSNDDHSILKSYSKLELPVKNEKIKPSFFNNDDSSVNSGLTKDILQVLHEDDEDDDDASKAW